MRRVTALRTVREGRVAVELDGAPWRVLPTPVVAAAGIRDGAVLGREAFRELRRALRRHDALEVAGRALRHRDLSHDAVDERLRAAGFEAGARASALRTLERVGFVDDVRLGETRAELLARRGYGDAAIRADLERRGVPASTAAACVNALEPERERIERVLAKRGFGPGAGSFLARRGFGEDAVEAALEKIVAREP